VDKLHDIAWDHISVPDHNPLYAQTSLDFLASYPLGTGGSSMDRKCCIQLVRLSMTNLSTCSRYVTETAVNRKERDKLFLGKVGINYFESIQMRINLKKMLSTIEFKSSYLPFYTETLKH
jgi:hypothetical protein